MQLNGWKIQDKMQIKHKKELRDEKNVFILPAISIERNSVTKDITRKGGVFGNVPGAGRRTIARRINQEKTKKFANADAFRLRGQKNYPRKNAKVVY